MKGRCSIKAEEASGTGCRYVTIRFDAQAVTRVTVVLLAPAARLLRKRNETERIEYNITG